jgi:hypothetical protein
MVNELVAKSSVVVNAGQSISQFARGYFGRDQTGLQNCSNGGYRGIAGGGNRLEILLNGRALQIS